MDLQTPGKRVQASIDRAGLTARSLAKSLGVSEQVISQIVNGVRSGEKRMPQIAVKLNVSSDWLRLGTLAKAPAWALTQPDAVAVEINFALAAENARLKAENTALKDFILAHHPKPAIFPQVSKTPLDVGQTESEVGVQTPSAPESAQPVVEHPQQSRRRPPGGNVS